MITKKENGKYSFVKYAMGVVAALGITLCFAVNTSQAEVNIINENLLSEKNNETFAQTTEAIIEELNNFQQQKKENVKVDTVVGWNVFVTKNQYQLIYPKQNAKDINTNPDGTVMIFINEKKPEDLEIARKYKLKLDPEKKNRSIIIIHEPIEAHNKQEKNKLEKDIPKDVFTAVEEMPAFIGGDESRANWMKENLKYPEIAKEKGIQGKVYVSFVAEKDGSVSRAKVVRGVDPILDNEALRLVNNMPKWQPGKQKGKNVAVAFTLPIIFKLNNEVGENAPTENTVYQVVDEMPVFIGGDENRVNWIKENLKYPEIAKEKGIKGIVFVAFIVEKDGSLRDAQVVRGVDPILDNEALRLIKDMPKWQPGKQKGQNVAVYYTQPIDFRLTK